MGRAGKKILLFFLLLLRGFMDLFYSRNCWGCGKLLREETCAGFCKECLKSLEEEGERCPRCGRRLGPHLQGNLCFFCKIKPPPFQGTVVLGRYEGLLGELIRRLKFGGEVEISFFLGRLLSERLSHAGEKRKEMDFKQGILVPVPLSRKRRRKRGFNQALLLGRELHRGTGMPIHARILKKCRDLPPQSSLPVKERMTALRGAFRARKKIPSPIVFLVDDVITTGSTVSECSRVLRRKGARKIFVVALAKS